MACHAGRAFWSAGTASWIRGWTNSTAYGIYASSSDSNLIQGNVISGLAPSGSGDRLGIYSASAVKVMIRDNSVATNPNW